MRYTRLHHHHQDDLSSPGTLTRVRSPQGVAGTPTGSPQGVAGPRRQAALDITALRARQSIIGHLNKKHANIAQSGVDTPTVTTLSQSPQSIVSIDAVNEV